MAVSACICILRTHRAKPQQEHTLYERPETYERRINVRRGKTEKKEQTNERTTDRPNNRMNERTSGQAKQSKATQSM